MAVPNIRMGRMMTQNKKQEREVNPPMTKLANGIAIRERMPLGHTKSDIPIVFLHGSGFNSAIFDGQFNSPILAHHHLIAVDLPGHGQSDNAKDPQSDYSYRRMGEKILDTLDLMGVSGAILAGWSLGGQIAIEVSDDDRVKGVCAFGVAPIEPGPMGLIRAFHFSRDLLLASKAQHTESEATRFEKACFGDKATGEFTPTIMRTDPAMRPAMSKTVLMGVGLDQKKAVEQPNKPMCIMQGDKDPFIRTDYLKRLDSLGLFTKEVIMLDDCGHAPFNDAPETFDMTLSDFTEWVEINAFAFDRALMDVANVA